MIKEQTPEPLPEPEIETIGIPTCSKTCKKGVRCKTMIFARDCLQLSDYARSADELVFLDLNLTSMLNTDVK
jgi:hypothetical protein